MNRIIIGQTINSADEVGGRIEGDRKLDWKPNWKLLLFDQILTKCFK